MLSTRTTIEQDFEIRKMVNEFTAALENLPASGAARKEAITQMTTLIGSLIRQSYVHKNICKDLMKQLMSTEMQVAGSEIQAFLDAKKMLENPTHEVE